MIWGGQWVLLARALAIQFVCSYHSMEWTLGWDMLHPAREGRFTNKYFSLVIYVGQLSFHSLSEQI